MISQSNVLFSIQPRYLKLILNGEKLIEFRNTYWKLSYPSMFYVYESKPISKIKYVIVLDKPYQAGEIIPKKLTSYGTEKFNLGKTDRKYAYPILKIGILSHQINLEELRSISITPPQNYLYLNNFDQLNKLLSNNKITYIKQENLF